MYGKYSQEYIEDVLVRFAYHSTGIEGNTLSLNDTRMILQYGGLPSEQGHSLREVYEVENHRQTFDYIFQEAQEKQPFSPFLVRNIHRLLTDHILVDSGQYKSVQNYILGTDSQTTEPFVVPAKMQEWCDNLNQPFQQAQNFNDKLTALMASHIEFERMHPFSDGNGRTGRMLINYGLILEQTPLLVIERNYREQYIQFEENQDVKELVNYAKEKLASEQERMDNLYKTAMKQKQFEKEQWKKIDNGQLKAPKTSCQNNSSESDKKD
ncbi:MAG: Fic family protein [Tetragenococcus sp.]|nr:Fic family protein [Tetragenococcus sp.]